MFNTSIKGNNQHHYYEHDGYDEFEAEIERQLAALGPLRDDELNDDENENESEDENKFSLPPNKEASIAEPDDSPLDSWNAFLEASKSRDKQIESWKQDLNEGLEDFVTVKEPISIPISSVHESPPTSTPSSPSTKSSSSLSSLLLPDQLLQKEAPTSNAPLPLEHILRDLKELQQLEQQQQQLEFQKQQQLLQPQTPVTEQPEGTSPSPSPSSSSSSSSSSSTLSIPQTAPSALDRERMQIEREIEARERMRKEEEERARREKEVEERRKEIERKREEEEARIAEEGRKLREKMEEVKRARDEMMRNEREREQERIRAQKEREEERKRRQEEERLREEEEEKERKRIADAERKARIERETRLREEARKRKEEEEKRAALKAEQEHKAKEEQEALRREQERRREEDEKKRAALIEAKKREIALLKSATKKKDGRASPSPSSPSSPSSSTRPSSATNDGRDGRRSPHSRQTKRSLPLIHAHSVNQSKQQTKSSPLSSSPSSSSEKEGLVHVSSSPASLVGFKNVESSPSPSVASNPSLSDPLQSQQSPPFPSQTALSKTASSSHPTQPGQVNEEPSLQTAQSQSHLPQVSSPLTNNPTSTDPMTSITREEPNNDSMVVFPNPPATTPNSLPGESKPTKTTDTWLEDNMRASNARLYQSSVVIPSRTPVHHHEHDKTGRETPPVTKQRSSDRVGQSPVLNDGVQRPDTTESKKSDAIVPKGVCLSIELISSNYPAIGLGNISHLDLSLESINKIQDLHHCPNLRSLFLNTNYIISLEGLDPCTNLEILELKNNPLAVLNFPSLPSLMNLSLDVCRLATLSSSLPNSMQSLSINGNQLTSLVELSNCGKLQHISARRNQLHSLPTSPMPDLLTLDVDSNKLRTLEDFSSWAPLLGSINASHNRLSSWPADLRAPLLRELHLNSNIIDTFGPVGFFPLLKHLDLSDNRITHLDWVGGFPLLDTLLLSRNSIAAFSALRPLAALRELRVLKLDSNPVASSMLYPSSLCDICPRLEEVDGQPFTSSSRNTRPLDALSPSYVKYWLNKPGDKHVPQPHDPELPSWWDFSSVLLICKKLCADASDMLARKNSQTQVDELALSRTHAAIIQALAHHPETFTRDFTYLLNTKTTTPENRAATSIQALWRGISCRSRLGLNHQYRVRHVRAAILIQKIWRGFEARNTSQYCKLKLVKSAAAVLIQKIWRGHVVRQTLKQARQAIREAFVDYGWDLGPAPSFELPVLEELDLEPPDEFFEDSFLDASANLPPEHKQVAPTQFRQIEPTIVYVQAKPPTPVVPHLSMASNHLHNTEAQQSSATPQTQPYIPPQLQPPSRPQSTHPHPHQPPQPSGLTGDAYMDSVATEWNFKDPKTLETLMKRERKRSTPNRTHQQLPARRASSHGYRVVQAKLDYRDAKVRSPTSPFSQSDHGIAKNDTQLPKRGRQMAPTTLNTLFISPHPPSPLSTNSASFLPGLKPPAPHHSSSNNNTTKGSGSTIMKKLPPITIVRPKGKD